MLTNKRKLNNQTIYQVFVRQFSATHDFKGVERQLDRIKALGTDILYLMPFYPIGKLNRKGSVGSPYSIYDYTAIDPLNGTPEDFKDLLNACHKIGIKVIIDMVLGHTSRDSVLLQEHEEWFYHRNGKIANKVGDWADVCDLDYSNQGLCDEIVNMLCYWANQGIDGFRMDVCSLIPAKLWEQAVNALHEINPDIIMLGESVELNFIREIRKVGGQAISDGEAYRYFDMLYAYDIQEAQAGFIENKGGSLKAWLKEVLDQEGRYPIDYVKTRYLDNHDRPRVASSYSGDKLKMLWALNFYLKGCAFIYAGDETQESNQNSLFEIDEVVWHFNDPEKDISNYISTLAAIKKHSIYSNGLFDIKVEDNAAVCTYESSIELSVGIFNFEPHKVVLSVPLTDGRYCNLINGQTVVVSNGCLECESEAIVIETLKRK